MQYYLSKEAEQTPSFLKNYEKGKKICFGRALKNRVAFYPGSECDTSFIDCINASKSVHIYIYGDYLHADKNIEKIKKIGYHGYHLLDDFDVPINKKILDDYLKEREQRFKNQEYHHFDVDEKVLCHTFIFERDSDKYDGTERFMLLYISMDAFYLYKLLFNNDKVNLFVALIQDHGFGCNYERFGREGLLNKIAFENSIYPKYMLCKSKEYGPWCNYDEVLEAEPVERFPGFDRYLYVRNINKYDFCGEYITWRYKHGKF